jgi:ceramide glucosyltransferase
MVPRLFIVFIGMAVCGALGGLAYYILCLWGAYAYLLERRRAVPADAEVLPPVSILKPLKGVDPEIYESFRSHCLQEYHQFEIIFGVSEPDDPAVQEVERLQKEFPDRSIQLIVCNRRLGTNVKVSNLVHMMGAARFDYLLVNDSDIRVDRDYLRRVVSPLLRPEVGMVTCLYRGVPGPTLGSRLESLGISTDFAGGVLAARSLEKGVRFGLGSTLCFRRAELDRIGGFQSLLDYLADDYELGKRIADLGLQIELSEVAVETFLPPYDLRAYFEHQLRWARSVRDSRRWGYVGVLLTFGLPWSLLALVLSRGAAWAWVLTGAVAVMRTTLALVVGETVLGDRYVRPLLPLIPLRDLAALAVWAASFASDRIAWRGDYFHLKNGKLARIER